MADPLHCNECGSVHPRGCPAHYKKSDPLEPCRNFPMKGAPTCRMHGSSAKQVRARAKRTLALGEAMADLNRLGLPIEVDPAEAMLQMVWEAAGNVAWARGRLATLPDDPSAWDDAGKYVKLFYNEERERLVKWAKACRDAGVEEHRVKLAERQGELLADVLRAMLGALLSALVSAGAPEPVVREVWASEVPGIVRKALGQASGEAA